MASETEKREKYLELVQHLYEKKLCCYSRRYAEEHPGDVILYFLNKFCDDECNFLLKKWFAEGLTLSSIEINGILKSDELLRRTFSNCAIKNMRLLVDHGAEITSDLLLFAGELVHKSAGMVEEHIFYGRLKCLAELLVLDIPNGVRREGQLVQRISWEFGPYTKLVKKTLARGVSLEYFSFYGYYS